METRVPRGALISAGKFSSLTNRIFLPKNPGEIRENLVNPGSEEVMIFILGWLGIFRLVVDRDLGLGLGLGRTSMFGEISVSVSVVKISAETEIEFENSRL